MKTLFLLIILYPLSVFASNRVIEIVISGNERTKKQVILDEIELSLGQSIDSEKTLEIERSLYNLNIFSFVKVTVRKKDNSKAIVSIKVQEKWTTIPIFKVASGGDVQQTTIGLYDPNLFGQYVEAGAQYERLEDINSGVVWFKNPRLFGKKQGVDLQLWAVNRLRVKYDQNSENLSIKNGFLHKRKKLLLAYNKGLTKEFNLKAIYEYNDDKFDTEFVPVEARSGELPPRSKVHFFGPEITYGNIYQKGLLQEGTQLQSSMRRGLTEASGHKDFWQLDFNFRHLKRVGENHQLATRVLFGATDTKVLQFWYYLGGLDRVRGFADNRFSGSYYWLNNLEFRYYTWGHKNIALQTIVFMDLVGTSEKLKGFATLRAASAGLGLRLYFPKLYRLTARLDYARPIKKDDDNQLSFGVQQFF